VKKRLVFISTAFSASFVLLMVMSFFSMTRFITYAKLSNLMDTSGFIIDNIYQSEVHLRDIQRSERGYLISKDTSYLNIINSSFDSIYEDLVDLQRLLHDNPEQQKNIKLLKDTIDINLSSIKGKVAGLDSADKNAIKDYLKESRSLFRACFRMVKVIHSQENKMLSERLESEHIYQKLTTTTLSYLIVIFCIITIVLFVVLIKELKNRYLFQDQLQAKVIDLERSHIELEEIAYAASHDLQEPLRKIQVFSDMLVGAKNGGLQEDHRETLKKISGLANRMQNLIANLLRLTSLTKKDELKKQVDLNTLINVLLEENEEKIKDSGAVFNIQKLPVISGYENQLKILFNALVDNSIKFARVNIPPIISIDFSTMDGSNMRHLNPNLDGKRFYEIEFSDNGVGFDTTYVEKIFKLFHKLPNAQPDANGNGIGLAICQRIVANHEGYISAVGTPNVGATFKLYFPVS
jgi:signal transduction histidine kinase